MGVSSDQTEPRPKPPSHSPPAVRGVAKTGGIGDWLALSFSLCGRASKLMAARQPAPMYEIIHQFFSGLEPLTVHLAFRWDAWPNVVLGRERLEGHIYARKALVPSAPPLLAFLGAGKEKLCSQIE